MGECGLHDGGVCEALRLSAGLLRSVGVGGDEVFEIQDRPGWLRPIAGGSMATLSIACFETVSWLRLQLPAEDETWTFETFWGMRRVPVPVHDLALFVTATFDTSHCKFP